MSAVPSSRRRSELEAAQGAGPAPQHLETANCFYRQILPSIMDFRHYRAQPAEGLMGLLHLHCTSAPMCKPRSHSLPIMDAVLGLRLLPHCASDPMRRTHLPSWTPSFVRAFSMPK